MLGIKTKKADVAAVRAQSELIYAAANDPEIADNRLVIAALANAKAIEAAYFAVVQDADAARGFAVWVAYRKCRRASAAMDNAHWSLGAAIEVAQRESNARSKNARNNASVHDPAESVAEFFRDKPNTQEVLKLKADVAAQFIISQLDGPIELATTLANRSAQVNSNGARQALMETAAFLLSLIDQPASAWLGTQNRAAFMSALEAKIVEGLRRREIEPLEFKQLLHERYEKYAAWPWMQNESTRKNVFWEFGKVVARNLGVGTNVLFQVGVETLLVRSLANYEIIPILRLPEQKLL